MFSLDYYVYTKVFGAKASSSMQSEPHNTSGSSLHVALPEHEKLTLTSKQRDSETERERQRQREVNFGKT